MARYILLLCATLGWAMALNFGGCLKNARYSGNSKSRISINAWDVMAKSLAAWTLAAATLATPMTGAVAADKRPVGAITGSGILFKDRLVVDAFVDPKIDGVTIYLSDFERPITDRMQKDFFGDPSQAGLTCARRGGKLSVKAELSTSAEGEEIVSEARSLFFKTLRVRRLYDANSNTAIYIAFSTRVNKDDDANKPVIQGHTMILLRSPFAAHFFGEHYWNKPIVPTWPVDICQSLS